MRSILFTIIFFVFTYTAFSQTQIPNGDFENWTDQYNAGGWNSINYGFPLEIHSAEQSSDANNGNYAAELTSQDTPLGMIPGLITLGEIDEANFTITGGIPFSERPNGISFFFKYQPSQTDTMYFGAVLTKWDAVNEETDTIGITGYFTNEIFNEYTYLAVPFAYASDENPDTLNVLFTSSGFSGNPGSNLIIDDVSLEYGIVLSPTICFPAENISGSNFTANWLSTPDAVSYRIDISEEGDFSSFYNGLENFGTGIDTFYTVDIVPGIYFYRTRVFYDPEVSVNSNIIAVPAPTNCLDASNVTANAFTANWEQANNASNYFIDVSESENFDSYVSGYENLSSGNQTALNITGLNAETNYYYRVRTEYGDYLSDHSNTVSLTTGIAGIERMFFDFNIYSEANRVFVQTELCEHALISLYTVKGQLIETKELNSSSANFSVSERGLYILKIQTGKHIFTRKIPVLY